MRAIVTFATDVEPGVREAFAPVSHGPLLAITGGSVTANEQRLLGELRSGREGRRDYIWERDRRKRDPLLVLRHDAHTVHLRVFPVAKNIRVTAVVEGFSLCPPTGLLGVRLYRTGPHYLAIVPLDHPAAVAGGADLTDEAGGRALLLLDRSRCRALFPDAWEDAREVPAVTALGQVLLGRGPAAVTNDTVLVALPAGSRAPRDLFVGPRARAPFTDTPLPPPVTDPTPPPPLPSVPPPPVSPTSAGAPSGADPTASD